MMKNAILAGMVFWSLASTAMASERFVREYMCSSSPAAKGYQVSVAIDSSLNSNHTRYVVSQSSLSGLHGTIEGEITGIERSSQSIVFTGEDLMLEIDLSTGLNSLPPVIEGVLRVRALQRGKWIGVQCFEGNQR